MGRPAPVDGKGRAGGRIPAGRPVTLRPGGYTPGTMPKFEKSPAALVERFAQTASRHPDAQQRQMFGYPALFTGGNYATGLFAERWVVRLLPEDLATLLALPDAAPFSPMPGRSMAGWASLPQTVVDDDAQLDEWIRRAVAFAASLPSKA